ncbi:hypothetical protein AK812_SmicGene1722 [Symbiodinium microadriaticum]|uniref:Integrase catalytic domain-containing protein n=1 Tax=Symbiodinium microadriaticum TaxID=2951 RepID=A0A1Q9F3C5_SYMMI|nr:hypothetical protein AK812_SmicGene1722 [Symbiodinium microadriaticum]
MEGPEVAFLSVQEQGNLEQAAKGYAQQQPQPSIKDLEKLLKEHPLTNLGKSRRKQKHSSDYHVFGTYAFGNHYGNTSRSRSLPELCRCVNRIMKHHLPSDMKWTSFAINSGTAMPTHRDVNNHAMYPNGSIGLGEYQGGEIWVEGLESVGGRSGKVTNREGPQGVELKGQEFDVRGKALVFSPKKWHGTCPWVGERWVITVFVSRGWDHLSQEERDELRRLDFPVPNCETQEAYPAEAQASIRERRKEDEKIRKKLYLLHCATGHSHPRHMIQALKRRGADERVLKLAEEFKCDVCKENQRPLPRNLAALEPLPPKLYTIGADIGHWVQPHTQMSYQFMIIVDEGSRFKAARILSSGSKQSPNAQTCLAYLQEGWVQYFGHPRALRLDPAGAFRSAAVEAWCDRHAVHLDIVPGEAHWKIGTVENAVRGVKELMTKLSHYDTEITAQEALAEAVWALNHREIIRGYSPAQHILGQAPDETGRFLPSSTDVHPNLLVENPTQEFERAAQRRAEAEKALAEWSAKQRIMRAQHSKHRPCYLFEPGELVYYWRTQDANKGRRQPGGKHGRFLGPARVLATESRKDANDQPRPGGSVWLVKGRSLLKCAPEQLRRATDREELMEALSSKSGEATPWTFKAVASEIGGNRYEDISTEVPPVAEWNRAQRIEEEAPPVRHRVRGKRPASQRQEPGNMEVEEEPRPEEEAEDDGRPLRERSRSRLRNQGPAGSTVEQPTAWWSGVPETKWPEQQTSFWNDKAAAVEVEFSFPQSQRGRDRAFQDLGAYFVGSMRRRAVELSERRMTAEEREAFQGAKAIEVKNFVASKAFEILPDHLKPDKAQAIGMRWILTWKLREDGSRKPKARAVLLGYQDGGYEHRATTSPVMTRTTRQVSRSTVETIVKANMLLAAAKGKKDHVMRIHSFQPDDTLTMVAWVDAAQGNRADGGSTQGIFLGVTTTKLLQGKIEGVSPLAWTSQKIDRACRSPGASEAQAAVNGEDALYAARFQWSELLYGNPNLHHPDDLVKLTGGCVVTDSRNVYDKLETEVLVIKGAEKRTSIELLAIKESQQNTQVCMRWVHSEAQLANSLTKAGSGGAREYELYYRMGHQWRLVEDESMMSAKRRKDLGLQPLQHAKASRDFNVVVEEE